MAEPDVGSLMTVAQAMDMIDQAIVSPRIVRVPLEQSMGLRLAEDIRADRDYPPFEKSLMDGYALHAADATASRELPVARHILAGDVSDRPLAPGQAMAIMTGAPMPAGADTVIPVEQTQPLDGGARVRILQAVEANRFIAARGSDVRAGTVVLKTGAMMGPAQLAVAASVGAAAVRIFAASTCSILGTGDEIVAIDSVPGHGQIRGSNNLMLGSLLRKLGCEVRDLGTVRDDRDLTRQAIVNGFTTDALFVTGGMSMGERDYVPGILKELGGDLRVTKLRIKPGKPFVFAAMPNGKYVFGLPGNPVSAFVCTIRLASRLLCRMGGGTPQNLLRPARLATSLPPNGPREFYQPAVVDGARVSPIHWKGSADIYALAQANALLVRPENDPAREIDDMIDIVEI